MSTSEKLPKSHVKKSLIVMFLSRKLPAVMSQSKENHNTFILNPEQIPYATNLRSVIFFKILYLFLKKYRNNHHIWKRISHNHVSIWKKTLQYHSRLKENILHNAFNKTGMGISVNYLSFFARSARGVWKALPDSSTRYILWLLVAFTRNFLSSTFQSTRIFFWGEDSKPMFLLINSWVTQREHKACWMPRFCLLFFMLLWEN